MRHRRPDLSPEVPEVRPAVPREQDLRHGSLRIRTIGPGLALGLALAVAACGGGDSAASPDELVRLHVQDTLDFRMDASDGPENVIPIDTSWVVYRDGSGTETVTEPAPGSDKAFELSAHELVGLKRALAALDLQALEYRFGTDQEGDGTTTVTYDGQTTTLDSRVMGFSPPAEAPPDARSFSRLVILLTRFTDPRPRGDSSDKPGRVGAEPEH
jgi:hypothetical protein